MSESLEDLAFLQESVVSRTQLRERGVTRDRLKSEVRARRWQRVGAHAVVLHTGPLTEIQRWWCALFNTGAVAVLAGVTAAEASGLTWYGKESIHVLVPKGSRPRKPQGVVVHESRRYDADDIHPNRWPPRTRVARSIVDAALWSTDVDRACALLAAGVQQGLTRPRELWEVLGRVRGYARVRLLNAVVGDIDGGAHALSELDFTALCRRAGLPEPDRQAFRRDSRGRKRYLDAEWKPWSLAAEADGGIHMRAGNWWADLDRANEIALAGPRVLRFPSVALRLHAERVVEQVRRGLWLGGWRGQP